MDDYDVFFRTGVANQSDFTCVLVGRTVLLLAGAGAPHACSSCCFRRGTTPPSRRCLQCKPAAPTGKTRSLFFVNRDPLSPSPTVPADYPFKCTSALIPGSLLLAMPSVPDAITQAVVEALFSLAPDSPASRATGFTYGAPQAYTEYIDNMRAFGSFRPQPDGSCLAAIASRDSIYDSIACPRGYFRKSRALVAAGYVHPQEVEEIPGHDRGSTVHSPDSLNPPATFVHHNQVRRRALVPVGRDVRLQPVRPDAEGPHRGGYHPGALRCAAAAAAPV